MQENQVVKNSQDHISSVFSLKIHRQNIKKLCDRQTVIRVIKKRIFGIRQFMKEKAFLIAEA